MNFTRKMSIALATFVIVLGLAEMPVYAQIPVFGIMPQESSIKFNVKASVARWL
jgi:hypothetical protein